LRRGEREPIGPSIDLRSLSAATLQRPSDNIGETWLSVARRFLGFRLCLEEMGCNWARRPLRKSQMHYAAVELWTQIPVLRAMCAFNVIPRELANLHIQVSCKTRSLHQNRDRGHRLGQLAPPCRLVVTKQNPQLKLPTRIAMLNGPVAASCNLPKLPEGALVEVFEELSGRVAQVTCVDSGCHALRTVPSSLLSPFNSWECPSWIASLPRPNDCFNVGDAQGSDCSLTVLKLSATKSTGLNRHEKVHRFKESENCSPVTDALAHIKITEVLMDNLQNKVFALEILNMLSNAQLSNLRRT